MANTLDVRLWARIHKTDTCWLWTARKNKSGYGIIYVNGKDRLATRVVWELLRSPIVDGYVIDHDNPEYGCGNPSCVNPDHLEPVSRAVNTQRARNLRKDNTSGVRGVFWNKKNKKWLVQVKHFNKLHYGGYFNEFADAVEASLALRKSLDEVVG